MTKEYTHQFVKQLNQYVDGQVHTNGIENFWSLLNLSFLFADDSCATNK
jgi:hypothetical protein